MKLTDYRVKKRKSQAQVARELNITVQTVSRAERGISISESYAKLLAEYYGVALDEIEGLKHGKRSYVKSRAS